METFDSIAAFGTMGNGPQYFMVYADNGSVIEYGKTADSRQELGGTVLNWMINRIEDIDGNYMTFTYFSSQRRDLANGYSLYRQFKKRWHSTLCRSFFQLYPRYG